jgi:hypothetical protein
MLSLRYNRGYGQIRLPCRPGETSFPYINQWLPVLHRRGSPVFIVVWLTMSVTSVTPEVHLSVTVVIVKRAAAVFLFLGQGRQLHLKYGGYI